MKRVDWTLAAALAAVAFAASVGVPSPPPTPDEITYINAAQDYLSGHDTTNFEHPPLGKLLIALSIRMVQMMPILGHGLFYSARLIDEVFAALSVGLLFLIARHLTRSTWCATIAGIAFLCDGLRFTVSRFALLESFSLFFGLLALGLALAYLDASQVMRIPALERRYVPWRKMTISAIIGCFVGLVVAFVFVLRQNPITADDFATPTSVVIIALCSYLGFLSARTIDYWSRSQTNDDLAFALPNGRSLQIINNRQIILLNGRRRSASATLSQKPFPLAGPCDTAWTYDPQQREVIDNFGTRYAGSPRRAWLLLVAIAVSVGLDCATKATGLFTFGFIALICLATGIARSASMHARFRVPAGLPTDITLGILLVTTLALFLAAYIPYFALGHSLLDLVQLQNKAIFYQQLYDTSTYEKLLMTHGGYASPWWEWLTTKTPFVWVFHSSFSLPNAGDAQSAIAALPAAQCCVRDVLALPNIVTLVVGWIAIPVMLVQTLRLREGRYLFLLGALACAWLPYAFVGRTTFNYYFLAAIPLLTILNVIALRDLGRPRLGRWMQLGYAIMACICIAYFAPILTGTPLTVEQWRPLMWSSDWYNKTSWFSGTGRDY